MARLDTRRLPPGIRLESLSPGAETTVEIDFIRGEQSGTMQALVRAAAADAPKPSVP